MRGEVDACVWSHTECAGGETCERVGIVRCVSPTSTLDGGVLLLPAMHARAARRAGAARAQGRGRAPRALTARRTPARAQAV